MDAVITPCVAFVAFTYEDFACCLRLLAKSAVGEAAGGLTSSLAGAPAQRAWKLEGTRGGVLMSMLYVDQGVVGTPPVLPTTDYLPLS